MKTRTEEKSGKTGGSALKANHKEKGMRIDSTQPFTLITGASAGIGRALAIECAKRNQNLILIALPDEHLGKLANHLADKHRIVVEYLEIDLTEKSAPQFVFDWCIQKRLAVNKIINNAGIMNRGSFEDHSPQFYEKMMCLNMNAVVLLTRLFLPELKRQKSASILNLGSMASFLPVPYKTVYAATKAFIYSFSIGLREELRGSTVKVHLLCPGSVPTNQELRERMTLDGRLSKLTVLQPDKVARITLHKMGNKITVIVPGFINRTYLFLGNFLPKSLRPRLMSRVFRKNHILHSQEAANAA